MIAKSPDDRQQTMLEVVQDLQRCARKDEATVPIARPAAVGSEQPQDWLAESPSSAMDDPLAWLEPASTESPADASPPETADLAETAAYRSGQEEAQAKVPTQEAVHATARATQAGFLETEADRWRYRPLPWLSCCLASSS